MDDDGTELISQLCTRIGMIMEDASVIALVRQSGETLSETTEALRVAIDRARALVSAAQALCEM